MEEFQDNKRNIAFHAGLRIHWFEYSADGIIMTGGFGTIIELQPMATWDKQFDVCWIHILCDDGKMRQIGFQDVDLEEEWDE